jgi:hypothetical protein
MPCSRPASRRTRNRRHACSGTITFTLAGSSTSFTARWSVLVPYQARSSPPVMGVLACGATHRSSAANGPVYGKLLGFYGEAEQLVASGLIQ